jgi:hypothetical protein
MSTSPGSPPDRRAAADTDQGLRPEHSDAALVPFLQKLERAIALRVDARLDAAHLVPVPAAAPAPRRDNGAARRIIRDAVAVSGGALLVAAIVGLHGSGPHQFDPGQGRVELPHMRFGPGSFRDGRIVLLPDVRREHGGRPFFERRHP